VHRIGRTGRAGASGIALSLCDSSERSRLRAIEKLIRRPINVKQVTIDFDAEQPAATPLRQVAAPAAIGAPSGARPRRVHTSSNSNRSRTAQRSYR
jgi:ATP-dependent RNA helicase RhlE